MSKHRPVRGCLVRAYVGVMLAFVFAFSLSAELDGSASSQNQIIRVEGARFRPMRIAIPEVRVMEKNKKHASLSRDITTVLREDFRISGVFTLLDPASYLVQDAAHLSANAWRMIEAEAAIECTGSVQGELVKLEVRTLHVSKDGGEYTKSYAGKKADLRRLIHKVANDSYKAITGEDGIFLTQIVAVRDTGRGKHVVIMDMDGKNQRYLTNMPGGSYVLPTFAPEGDRVYVTSLNRDQQQLLELMIGNLKTRVISARPGLNIGARVSPDRRSMALTLSKDGNSDIYVLNRNGEGDVRLTVDNGLNTSPDFSPDGKEIAFVSSRSGNPNIFVMNADGSSARRVTFEHSYNQTPKFGPQGDVLVYMGRDENNAFDLFALDLKTETTSRITKHQGRNEDPWFSPNGRLIVFTSTRDSKKPELYISSLDGTMQRRITFEGGFQTPSWGPMVK